MSTVDPSMLPIRYKTQEINQGSEHKATSTLYYWGRQRHGKNDLGYNVL